MSAAETCEVCHRHPWAGHKLDCPKRFSRIELRPYGRSSGRSREGGPLVTDWNDIAHDMASQTEAQLVAFFGTVENAQHLAHLYVIEQHPLVVESEQRPGGAITLRASRTWRLRLKTDEELAAEQEQRS